MKEKIDVYSMATWSRKIIYYSKNQQHMLQYSIFI